MRIAILLLVVGLAAATNTTNSTSTNSTNSNLIETAPKASRKNGEVATILACVPPLPFLGVPFFYVGNNLAGSLILVATVVLSCCMQASKETQTLVRCGCCAFMTIVFVGAYATICVLFASDQITDSNGMALE